MIIAENGAHFFLLFKPISVIVKNTAAKAASAPAIKESSRYIPFQVLAGKAAHMAIAVMSKSMFAAIRSVSVLWGLLFGDFDIQHQSSLTGRYSLTLRKLLLYPC